jgi:hypothetical protein
MQLINNAGMAFKGSIFGHKEAEITLKTNLFGTRKFHGVCCGVHHCDGSLRSSGTMDVTDRLLEYLRKSPDGRVVKYVAHKSPLIRHCSQFVLLND